MIRRLIASARSFARAERGATAVEFGLILVPLMLLIFGVLELGGVFLVTTTLETATETASRTIRVGAFQQGQDPTKAAFKALVCNNMSWLSARCSGDLYVEAQTFSTYAALAANQPVTVGAQSPQQADDALANTCWTTGQPGDIVLVRVYYRWNLFTPGMDLGLDNTGGGQRLITATTAFRNEPYNDNQPQGTRCA